ncbi:hypothetical protein DC347_08100 [Pseudarthrobacter sp. AG30]|uniref:hypothetical protein n=1 Tax=Pseudarthrobacter sp. AG30 TaxID=2249742 RepID=UPI000D64D4B4|nr:hypothetical protein [Pseudarthrobacter sp. AG30]RAX17140.1 hypothetical protein DC347_08100 [Pseudarthrobacter sp. AG30]
MSTPSLADLLARADADGHDHSATEKATGLLHIHNHATGSIIWFPTWKKFRETTDWTDAVTGITAELSAASAPADQAGAALIAADLEALLDQASRSADAAVFVQENLIRHLTRTWAVGDAVAQAGGKDLFTSGPTPAVFAGYPYDVYAQDGGVFATTLWNDLIDARRNRALAEEAARKALKPVSRKAMKNAARKAARR